MENLPNGFTGFANRPDGFESAGEASRRRRAAAAGGQAAPLHYAREAASSGRKEKLPFQPVELEDSRPYESRMAWTQIDLSAIASL